MPTTSRRLAHFTVWWLVCYVLWLALTTTVARTELVTGIFASALAAGAAAIVHARDPERVRLRPTSLRMIVALPWRIVADTVLVTRALVGGRRGRFATVDVDLPDDPREVRASIALSTVVGSIAPNHYIVDIDEARGVAVVHELVRTKPLSKLSDVIRNA